MPFAPFPGHRAVGETAAGYWVEVPAGDEPYRAFVPKGLPPEDFSTLSIADLHLVSRAERALGRLDGMADVFPDIDVFLAIWLLKEAVYSSQIEGTQSSLSDLLIFEMNEPLEAVDDLRETANYVAAVKAGIASLDALPLSMRLLREAHERLLQSGRGSERQPGIVRTSQNWIGGTRPGNARYVPPPPQYLDALLTDLENFLNDVNTRTPLLVKAALAHAQFETIHPFLDGNGRVGRLLIVLILCADGALRRPLLYISLFFKRNRDAYYEALQRTRTDADWLGWLRIFFEAVEVTANEAVESARKAMRLFAEDERRIALHFGTKSGSAMRVFRILQTSPIVNVASLQKRTGLTKPTVSSTITGLMELGLLRELTGARRNRLFGYAAFLTILQEENP